MNPLFMKCKYCTKKCIKKGKIKDIQRYQCKTCRKYQQSSYTKPHIPQEKYDWTLKLNNEGCGISNIGRLLEISKLSVQRLIERIASKIKLPVYEEVNQSYELDELRTYCGNKKNECWLMYGINKRDRKVITLCVGRRTKENIKQITAAILAMKPKRIYTDGLNVYAGLVPKPKHQVFQYCTNKIERHNLTLRTHLKRLSRKTLCYTKNAAILENCLRIYCFGG